MSVNDESDRRNLSMYQLEVLLKETAKQDTSLTKSNRTWLHTADIKQLLVAIDHDAERAYLSSMGREFSITYKGDKIWLSPSDGRSFTPCGWFSTKDLQREVDLGVNA